jgi:hypothetical protein
VLGHGSRYSLPLVRCESGQHSWITAPKFDVDALRDIGIQHEVTVAQGYQTTVELMNATTEVKYGDNY